ncbi:hypothetical protein RFI_04848 [Reticulomyxa filosa]|uniref:Uncharacterized protein n=1 Tax=Reticulomyxa filosa TaxID=46433 RepID=X6P2G2_RETFI|nr:hypothetical protein RFI_04848 [Reticulomyxa filosa]|eukprot:ETO32269.1 hypothetical protein RFI_04848 [Reticulomyxa filosa]
MKYKSILFSHKKQLDDVFECLKGLKYENECIRALCRSLETISTKLNQTQFDRVFTAFIDGLEDKFNWHHRSCKKIACGLTDENEFVCNSYAKLLGVISTNLTDKQLEGIVNALKNNRRGFRRFDICNYEDKERRLVELLKLISTKLNDKQLYLLVIYLLERAEKGCIYYNISEDMWKRATICGLKENIEMKHENTLMNKHNSNHRIYKTANNTDIQLLVFGLMTFNPRIQLSCDY